MTMLRGNERAERINALKSEGKSVSDIAKELGVSKPTVYNTLKGGTKRKTATRKTTPRQLTSSAISILDGQPIGKPIEDALGMVSILQTGNGQAYVQMRVESSQVARIVSKIFA